MRKMREKLEVDAKSPVGKGGLMFGNPNMLQCRWFGRPTTLKPDLSAGLKKDLVWLRVSRRSEVGHFGDDYLRHFDPPQLMAGSFLLFN
jgi:hypothetical protein